MFTILFGLSIKTYQDALPVPQRAFGPSGETVLTEEDILAGQRVFVKYGLMDNGTIWGHHWYRTIQHHHGPCGDVFGTRGGASYAVNFRRLGLRKIEPGECEI